MYNVYLSSAVWYTGPGFGSPRRSIWDLRFLHKVIGFGSGGLPTYILQARAYLQWIIPSVEPTYRLTMLHSIAYESVVFGSCKYKYLRVHLIEIISRYKTLN